MSTAHEPSQVPPPAEGVRIAWADLPQDVRARVERALGSSVISAVSQPGGFSPGVAARLRLADGRRVFVKAISALSNPDAPRFHRREAAIVAALPTDLPVPRLLWQHDGTQTDENGWVILVFEDVEGSNPPLPWAEDHLARVLEALAELSRQLTPSPLAASQVPTAHDIFTKSFSRWREAVAAGPEVLDRLDPWSQRHLEQLLNLESLAPAAVEGNTLLHTDIRADNILLTDDRVWFVDWPHAAIGAAWVDSILFAPSVAMQGGASPEFVLTRHPAAGTVDPAAVDAVVAATAGFFTYLALLPPPPGLPTLRAFQAAQGTVARQWLADRLGWA